jgi:hypothetical protein
MLIEEELAMPSPITLHFFLFSCVAGSKSSNSPVREGQLNTIIFKANAVK